MTWYDSSMGARGFLGPCRKVAPLPPDSPTDEGQPLASVYDMTILRGTA